MAYISQTEKAIKLIEVGAIEQDSSLLKGIIKRDRESALKKEMAEGQKYYEGTHDVLNKNFQLYHVKGSPKYNLNAANNRIPVSFHQILVDQKAEYIAGKPLQIAVKDSEEGQVNYDFKQQLVDMFGLDFQIKLNKLIIGASNKSTEVLHLFYDQLGELNYLVLPTEQFIPDFDALTQELKSCIRYYPVDFQDPVSLNIKKITKAEVWDKEKVTFYIENPETGNFSLDISEENNPRPHWLEYLSTETENKEAKSWGRVPFIFVYNNISQINDLRRIKPLIDVYDKLTSKFSNTIEDIQEALAVVKNYEGTSKEEFYEYLRVYKVAFVGNDGGVEFEEQNIPFEATLAILNLLEDKIYMIGRGVNLNDKAFGGDVTGVALKMKFSGLDMKANQMITQLKQSLREFMWFICEDLNSQGKSYDPSIVDFTFDKSLIFNEAEVIDNINKSRGIMSEKQMQRKHPYIDDLQRNEQELEEEKTEISLDTPPQNIPANA